MKKVLLKIDGMTCSACSSGLEKYLNKQDGVSACVNLVMNNANVEYDDTKYALEDIEKFVAKAGFKSLGIDKFEKEEKKRSKEKYKLTCITILSLFTLYISMSHMVSLPQIPAFSMMAHPLRYAVVLAILSLLVIIFAFDIIKNGYKNLIHLTPNMDTLVTIGVFASYIYSMYSTVKIYGGESAYVESLYFESCAMVLFFIKIGKYIESKNKDKTKDALKELMTITPNHATIIRDEKEIIVTLDEIKKGDIVLCVPGEKIAVDGTIIEGTTHIDESFITGESVPVKREKGQKVIAGSINYDGAIKYSAENIGRDSTVSQIVRMVAEASSTKAPISRVADKISSVFVPIVIILSVITFLVWIILTGEISVSLEKFVSVLVVACPCGLGLATPLAIVIASGVCTKKGILVKSSEALENAHKVKTIVLDKTGTITKGKLTVSKIYNYSAEDERDILKYVASIEKKSEHPIAKAIVNYAKEKDIELVHVDEFSAIPGGGVKAKIEGHDYLIGNEKLLKEKGIKITNSKDIDALSKDANSILLVSKDDNIISLIGVKDTIKEGVKDTITKFKQKDINVVMLTGDNEKTAQAVAAEVGIDTVFSNVRPDEKAKKIQELKEQGLVLMCGDGINDSVSLVSCDIGVSVSNGTDIAMDSSNVVLMVDNLDRINDLIYISQKTVRNIKQNLFFAFIYNICMIPVAMGVFVGVGITLNPMMAALAMTLSSLTVVLNALRLRNIKIKSREKK